MRKIRAQMGPRVETGAIQIGDDWPGLFIRGDCAFGYALHLRNFVENPDDEISAMGTKGLLKLLESCDERVSTGLKQK